MYSFSHNAASRGGRRGEMRRAVRCFGGVVALCGLLSGCVPTATQTPERAAASVATQVPMARFTSHHPSAPARSNREMARDFVDLAFELESGRPLSVFTRFEGPITVRVTGAPPPTLHADLDALLQRLRREAGIDIRRTDSPDASITLQAVSRAEIRNTIENAACFVVPNITDLSQYRAARRSGFADWGALRRRERMAVIVPNDSAPQEVRDCLHEELAQAIGPLNDLYRLPDSVFNDDNVHTVLTGFDMLMLRAYYHPDLHNGMNRAEVAARIEGILDRLNPGGIHVPTRHLRPEPRMWGDAILRALGPGSSAAARRRAAMDAVRLAQQARWQDHRRGFSHLTLARIIAPVDPTGARHQLELADHFFSLSPHTDLHRAFVGARLAEDALERRAFGEAIEITRAHIPTARRYENAALLATLMVMEAAALSHTGQMKAAKARRLDSLAWARYGFSEQRSSSLDRAFQ